METKLDSALRSPSHPNDPNKPNWAKISSKVVVQASLWALAITLLQIAVACWLSGRSSLAKSYLTLFEWDSLWYANIINNGYFTTIPPDMSEWGKYSNVSFFPGYPALAFLVQQILKLSTEHSLLLTAQLAGWGFWTYLLLLFDRLQIPKQLVVGSIVAILVHPGSFYLVAAYSEPLFLVSLMGLIYWTDAPQKSAWVWAAISGFMMSATRLVGLPLALFPLIALINRPKPQWSLSGLRVWVKDNLKYFAIAAISMLGGLLFFVFCQWRFGYWDLYMQSTRNGWWVIPDYFVLSRPWFFQWMAKLFSRGLDPDLKLAEFGGLHFPYSDEFSRLTIPFSLGVFLICLLVEIAIATLKKDQTWKQRLGLYFCSWTIFYISATGMANRALGSMIRHSFPTYVLLVLAIAYLLTVIPFPQMFKQKRVTIPIAFLLILLSLLSLAVQGLLEHRFTHGLWVS
ncbi:hypothetical protein [Pseudanabaena sp. PCC 6802]|uniref:hypothetical protein n=1 Tax=Pseudanabaena sp. PCC 6802 TaxID=118173 RepID=UPI0012EA90A3|nr:hypothetical protein [Pseudanabaena sp. PCC 6802]